MLGLILAMSAVKAKSLESLPPIPREFRAAWVATVDNIDFPSKRTLSSLEQQDELRRIIRTAANLNLNALVFQIRPHADALYPSKLEPWSAYLTGVQGVAPNPYWDPLQFAVDESHKLGIELHVWFNPYRADHPAHKAALSSNHITRTSPNLVRQYGEYKWLDPSETAVKRHTQNVIMDVLKRYDIDGVHIDDYFYPYPSYAKGASFPDEANYKKHLANGGKLSRGDWRRQHVDEFVKTLYWKIKDTKKWVKFGISPFGIYRPNHPAGIKAGIDQYSELYADCKKWLRNGWCDYFAPQLYWPIDQAPQSYRTLLRYWVDENAKGRHIWPGLYTGRTSPSEGNWKPSEIINQIGLSRKMQQTAGNIHFSFKCLQYNYNGIFQALNDSAYATASFVPESNWLGSSVPKAPKVGVAKTGESGISLEIDSEGNEYVFAFCTGTKNGRETNWSQWKTLRATSPTVHGSPDVVAVVAFSRTGKASSPRILEIP
jgi:uncharacterized lipoprotein YddW (UPF0748 family)